MELPEQVSYQAIVALYAEPGSSGARYHAFLFEAFQQAALDDAAMAAFRASLTVAEQHDLEWWLDEVFRRYDQYQEAIQTMLAQAQAARELGADTSSAGPDRRAILQAAAPAIKWRWQALLPDLSAAYAYCGRPQGFTLADLQRWAAEVAPLRRAARVVQWKGFLAALPVDLHA
ncbi:MAG TPA: hypothetical protein VF707_01905 [Ardenticatenaceae bacterium]|jgi:hypothetical protein